jgi:hypothetical protein
MKTEVDQINAVPSKRIFRSIIVDYDLNRSICELIDNSLDIWVKNGKNSPIKIEISPEVNQQTLSIKDNAGGVKKSELELMVAPGQTSNLPTDTTIGIFGVGTKRAVVALAQDIKISTRYGKYKPYRIEFDDTWLESPDWSLPVYEIDGIPESTTIIELQKLRYKITNETLRKLKDHLEATYAKFLQDDQVTIVLNKEKLQPLFFENWAFPPDYTPRKYVGTLNTEDGKSIRVEIFAGLSAASTSDYGVHFYCNNRLIVRGLKSYDVGFTPGLAGKPHSSIALTNVIVSLEGEAELMPWNSSKSGINPNHNVFIALRDFIINVVKEYASLSRRFLSMEGNWPKNVFKYPEGEIIEINNIDFPNVKKSYLPPLPKIRKQFGDTISRLNRKVAKDKPWTTGLYEAIIALDIIFKKKLNQKNRICLIILDSTLEIAFKDYLVNESGGKYSEKRLLDLFKSRDSVQEEIKKYIDLNDKWDKINYYYRLRCKLVHERATVGIDNSEIEDFREVVQEVLNKLFGLEFEEKE